MPLATPRRGGVFCNFVLRMAFAALVVAVAMRSACADEMTIVSEGKSEYVIAVSDGDAVAGMVREAAEALQGYIRESTGCALPIVREGEVGARPAFYLGRTKKGEAAGVPYGKFVDYVHCRKAVGRDVFLAGNDESANIKGELQHHDHEYLRHKYGVNSDVKDLSYRRWHGTLKAVLELLETEGVVKFLMPGENGLNILKRDSLRVPGGMDFLGQAQIPYSNSSCYGGLHTTVALGHVDIPYNKTWGGHPFPVAVPRAQYEKTHPEYFILKDGVRRPDFGPAGGGHPCVSNPEVFELFMAEMKRQYDVGFRWIQVGPTDGQVACECDACRKMHPSPQERQWLFYRKVAEAAKTRLPGATMVLLSYDFTADAPTSFDAFPDNVAIELCIWKNFREKFENWARFRDLPKIAYVYFFGMYHSIAIAPTRSPRYIADCMRILRDNNVKCIFKCGWAEDIGLEAPICYVFSKLLDNPDADPDKLVEEFCDAAYGKAAGPMKGFFKTLYAGMDTPGGHSVIDEFTKRPHHPEEMFEYMFRPYPVVTRMSALLGAAEGAKDPDPKVRARLKLVRRSYDFLRLRAQSYFLNDAYSALGGSQDVLAAAGRVYDAREKLLDGWYDAKGAMIGNEGFDWHYLRNLPRERLVCGGGLMPPNFPSLFRYGPGNVKAKLEKHEGNRKQ